MKSVFFIITLLVLSFSCTSWAVDLTHRLGVGYSDQFSVSNSASPLPSIAVRYYPQPRTGFSAALGVNTESNNSKFGLIAKIYRIIFPEDNMNFYMGASAGLISTKISGTNNSGFELSGFVGAEFFLSGLESLGISFEAGIGISSVSSGVTFRTIADHPLKAGIIFYF